MIRLSVETCAAALNIAAMNRKSAFQTELAVGLAVFLVNGDAGKVSKSALCEAYAAAGYQCLRPVDIDYKTINRRINATADLYGKVNVKAWAAKLTENDLLRAIYIGLEPYELSTVADVQRYCNPPKKAGKKTPTKPHMEVLAGPVGTGNTGQTKIVSMFQRAAEEVRKGADHIETAHLAIMIPQDATRDELIELAGKLIALAEKKKELLTV